MHEVTLLRVQQHRLHPAELQVSQEARIGTTAHALRQGL